MTNPVKDESRRSYGVVIRKTWRSKRFRNKSHLERLLLTYLWSCPAGENSSSIFYLALPTIADDLGTDTGTVTRTVRQMVSEGWFEYDEEARVFFLPRQIEFDKPENPNTLKSFIKRTIELPDTPLLAKFYQQLKPFIEQFGEQLPEQLREQLANCLANTLPNPIPIPEPIPEPKVNSPATPDFEQAPEGDEDRRKENRKDCILRISEWFIKNDMRSGTKDPQMVAALFYNRYEPFNPTPNQIEWILQNRYSQCNDAQHIFQLSKKRGDEVGQDASDARRAIVW